MTFEESLEKLTEIVSKLENENMALEESIDLYKQGIELSVSCKKQLEDAKLKITEYKTEE